MLIVRFFKKIMVILLLFMLAACADKAAKFKPLRVVCLGDSITYGYKLENPAKQSYPAQLNKLSRGQWHVLNSGVNGATLLKQGDIPIVKQAAYQRAMKFRPDVVVVILGTNDMKKTNWKYRQHFVSDYGELIENFRTLESKPHIIACTIPPIFGAHANGFGEEKTIEINRKVRQVVAHENIDLLDIYTPLLKREKLFQDGVHPDARGAQEIAILVLDKVSSL